MPSLEEVFSKLKTQMIYGEAVKNRIAKIILSASVIRAFTRNTKTGLLKCLTNLEVDSLLKIDTAGKFDAWHALRIKSVYHCLFKTNSKKFKNHLEGLKWGHATKIFNLYLGHLYFYSPYFEGKKGKTKIHKFLHVPLDSKIFKALRKFQVEVPKSIKTVNPGYYRNIQQTLRNTAFNKGVDPLRFDYYAWALG